MPINMWTEITLFFGSNIPSWEANEEEAAFAFHILEAARINVLDMPYQMAGLLAETIWLYIAKDVQN
jgi:hypothetical protein